MNGEDPRDQDLPTANQPWYTQFAIQPIDFIMENKLDFLEGNIIKYVLRYKAKGGVEDLHKARVYLEWMIEASRDKGIGT